MRRKSTIVEIGTPEIKIDSYRDEMNGIFYTSINYCFTIDVEGGYLSRYDAIACYYDEKPADVSIIFTIYDKTATMKCFDNVRIEVKGKQVCSSMIDDVKVDEVVTGLRSMSVGTTPRKYFFYNPFEDAQRDGIIATDHYSLIFFRFVNDALSVNGERFEFLIEIDSGKDGASCVPKPMEHYLETIFMRH